jgi:hypothetical protein
LFFHPIADSFEPGIALPTKHETLYPESHLGAARAARRMHPLK